MIGGTPNWFRLWEQSSRKENIARDVMFDEESFPFTADDDEIARPLVILIFKIWEI